MSVVIPTEQKVTEEISNIRFFHLLPTNVGAVLCLIMTKETIICNVLSILYCKLTIKQQKVHGGLILLRPLLFCLFTPCLTVTPYIPKMKLRKPCNHYDYRAFLVETEELESPTPCV